MLTQEDFTSYLPFSPLRQVVTIPHADILLLQSVPYELIAAPPAGKAIVPFFGVMVPSEPWVAYANGPTTGAFFTGPGQLVSPAKDAGGSELDRILTNGEAGP